MSRRFDRWWPIKLISNEDKHSRIIIRKFGMAIEVVDRWRSERVETMTKAKKREHGMSREEMRSGWH